MAPFAPLDGTRRRKNFGDAQTKGSWENSGRLRRKDGDLYHFIVESQNPRPLNLRAPAERIDPYIDGPKMGNLAPAGVALM